MARQSLAFAPPPALALGAGATEPDPGGMGATVWSTVEARVLVWDGTEWQPQAVVRDIAQGAQGAHYVHTQGVATDVWIVTHNLGKVPSVTVIDSLGDEVRGDTRHDSPNQVTLTFSYPFSGSAHCN